MDSPVSAPESALPALQNTAQAFDDSMLSRQERSFFGVGIGIGIVFGSQGRTRGGLKAPRPGFESDSNRDFWLNAEESAKYGLADKVITTRPEIQ